MEAWTLPLEDSGKNPEEEMHVSLEGSSESPSREVFTVANVITFTRLILILVFLWLFGATPYRTAAIVVFVVAAVSDFLDGVIARNTGSVSWLGKVLDPIVDRFLLFTGIIGLLIREELPLWIGILLIMRDLILAYGMQMVHKYRSRPVDVVFIGKLTTALLLSGFTLMLVGKPEIPALGLCDIDWLPLLNHESASFGMLLVYLGTITSIITFFTYFYQGMKIRHDALAAGWKRDR